jgi:hypothetical protein
MLQRHYPVPVAVLRKICKYPSTAAIASWFEEKRWAARKSLSLGRGRSQREPNPGNRVDVPTVHGADPLIFPLPKHFCGRVYCSDERWFFLANRVFSHEFFRLVWLKDWNNIISYYIYIISSRIFRIIILNILVFNLLFFLNSIYTVFRALYFFCKRGIKSYNREVPKRCTCYRFYFIWRLLYVFRATPSPIFSSTKQL